VSSSVLIVVGCLVMSVRAAWRARWGLAVYWLVCGGFIATWLLP
jgi:hypothetical protein